MCIGELTCKRFHIIHTHHTDSRRLVMRKVRTGISREEEEKIVGYILDGMNCNKIAKLMKRDRGVVKRIAKKHSVELIKNMKHAVIPEVLDCIPKYSRYMESIKRQALISNMMSRVETALLSPTLTAGDMKNLAITMGICVDKFAVELGKTDDAALAALRDMFVKMEKNVTVDVNAIASSSGETGSIYNGTAKENEHSVRELEEQQNNSCGLQDTEGTDLPT